jgi:hypothetical protein
MGISLTKDTAVKRRLAPALAVTIGLVVGAFAITRLAGASNPRPCGALTGTGKESTSRPGIGGAPTPFPEESQVLCPVGPDGKRTLVVTRRDPMTGKVISVETRQVDRDYDAGQEQAPNQP